MNRLLEIGFQSAGHWLLDSGNLRLELTRHSTQVNILYAFICDGDVMYVGKTKRTLAARMMNYKNPSTGQGTNKKNNKNIRAFLNGGSSVEILALPDNGLLHYGKFHLNLAAALEDDIIRVINPPWNGGKPESVESETDAVLNTFAPQQIGQFHFVLQPTYFRTGFFNVDVSNEKLLGADGEIIELFLGNEFKPVLGTINRRANLNGSPRLMGGTLLRDWFKSNATIKQIILVQVLSPTSIRIIAA